MAHLVHREDATQSSSSVRKGHRKTEIRERVQRTFESPHMLILFLEFYLRKKFVDHLFTVVFKVLGKQFCFVPTVSLAQCVFGLAADVYTSPQ